MPSLTVSAVKAAKAEVRPRKLFDGGGLYLYVTPAGAKTWRLQYRVEGKQQQRSLGPWPEIGLVEAREEAYKLRHRLRQGEDIKKATRPAAVSFREAANAYFDGRRQLSANYRDQIDRALAMHLHPFLGDRPIGSITRDDLLECLNRMDLAGHHVYVRKVRGWVDQTFEWAVNQGLAATNVAATINSRRAFGTRKVEHLAAVPLSEVGPLLRRLSLERVTQVVRCCRLHALTWLRSNELRQVRWDMVKGDVIECPKEIMKGRRYDHLVPLSTQAIKLLEEQRYVTGEYPYVFVQDRRTDSMMSENAVLYLLHRIGYGPPIQGEPEDKLQMTTHGWRTVGSTWANEHGYMPEAIERQLAHVPGDKVRAAYNRAEYITQRRQILQDYADWLAAQEAGCCASPASSASTAGPAPTTRRHRAANAHPEPSA